MKTPRRRSARVRVGAVMAGLSLVACTSDPPVPQPAPAVEAPPVAVAETPAPVAVPPPVSVAPPMTPPATREPTTLTLHAVVLADDGLGIELEDLPSGHVLFRDSYNFMVYPARGDARTDLHPLPKEVLWPQFLINEDAEADGVSSTLEALHGAWPDQFYVTTETTEARASTERLSRRWQDGEWVVVESPTTDKSYTLGATYERFMPWVKGRYLVERRLSCTAGCPEDSDELSAADHKLMLEIERKLARWKPYTVVGGKATALPDLPADGFQVMALASGDLYVMRRNGKVDRWNLTSKTWQSYDLPAGKLHKMAGTSAGAAYYATCEPAYLGRLVNGTITAIPLPKEGCIATMQVDRTDRLWIVLRESVATAGIRLQELWRLDGETWQEVKLTTTLAGGPKRWSFDGLSWREVEVPTGTFAVRPYELRVFGPDEVWVKGTIEAESLAVLARAEPGPPLPFDLRTVPPPFDDAEPCFSQYIRVGTLLAGEKPMKAWPAALKYLAELANHPPGDADSLDPHLYEVDDAGQRVFYATLGETTEQSRTEIEVKLAALLPGVSEFTCGRAPQPIREHDLPRVEEDPEAPEEAPSRADTKAEAPRKVEANAETKAEVIRAAPPLPGVMD